MGAGTGGGRGEAGGIGEDGAIGAGWVIFGAESGGGVELGTP